MTRATTKPVRRLVNGGMLGELVIEIRADTLTLRPKGAWRGKHAEVHLQWGLVYQIGLVRRPSRA